MYKTIITIVLPLIRFLNFEKEQTNGKNGNKKLETMQKTRKMLVRLKKVFNIK